MLRLSTRIVLGRCVGTEGERRRASSIVARRRVLEVIDGLVMVDVDEYVERSSVVSLFRCEKEVGRVR